MDEIFSLGRKDILDPIIYGQATSKMPITATKPLEWDDLPPALVQGSGAMDDIARQNRYIWVREARSGHTRFLVSDRFQQEIASLWLLEETWKANDKPVVQVFLEGHSDFDKFIKAVNYVMSRYTDPDILPGITRVNGLKVKLKQQPQSKSSDESQQQQQMVQEMDLVYAFEIINLEHSFYLAEFVHPKAAAASAPAASQHDSSETRIDDEQQQYPSHAFDSLIPAEMDQDFEAFVALLDDIT